MATFDQPTTTTLHVNEAAWFYNLPVPTRIQSQQYMPDESLGAAGEQFIHDGFFELMVSEVGRIELTLSADGYDDLFVSVTVLEALPEEPPEE